MQHLGSSTEAATWLKARGAHALRTDHRLVRPGDAFLAWPGRSQDARLHAGSALAAGAAACLLEARGLAPGVVQADDERLACLDDLKRQAGEVADEFFDHPSRALDVVAVTGTNGKTSSTWWLAQALGILGRRCGVVGTLGVGDPFHPTPGVSGHVPDAAAFESTGLTTPDAVALQAAFRRFADGGLTACAIEASSIGIVEHRLAGTTLAVAAFTNLTQDHLDYHGTMAAYGSAKRALFDTEGLKVAVLNVDDPLGLAWVGELAQRTGLDLWTVSAAQGLASAQPAVSAPGGGATGHASAAACADTIGSISGSTGGAAPRLWARAVRHTPEGLELALCERAAAGQHSSSHLVRTPLIGAFNVENLLVVAGCLRALGVPLKEVARVLGLLTPVPGRLERVPAVGTGPQPAVVVDYAHTPDALDKALQALAPLAAARGGRLWCVFGCGGDRDAAKRPLMGRAAVQGAAHVVVTSDNPRSEAPAHILAQVMTGAREAGQGAGLHPPIAIEDRRAAIVHAVHAALPADVVLIAGKGHEQTQEIAGVKRPFSDVAEAASALAGRRAHGGTGGLSLQSVPSVPSVRSGPAGPVAATEGRP